ncbi:MAG: hypothetical protein RLZZ04_506 [Cyanobacteriota bacterium]|jgi:hypothetical protein
MFGKYWLLLTLAGIILEHQISYFISIDITINVLIIALLRIFKHPLN